jgi:hypothetical protein
MKRSVRGSLFCMVAAFTATHAMADDALVAEAMKRGLVGKSSTPSRPMSAARWNREQQAALEKSNAIMQRAQREPGLLAQYEWMRAHYDDNASPLFRTVFGQYFAWFQTWVGDYVGAQVSFSIAQPAQADDAPSPTDSGVHARPAAAAILELTRDRKAVFFNEAHQAPLTRTLTLQMLAGLRAQGFDYFAVETLSAPAMATLQRGYPTPRSGFYINEPIYGDMVRTALRLGYHVIAYDAEESASDVRERGSAQALYEQTFKRDPNARLVVNAGFSHIAKAGEHLGGASMAQVFQKLSGIEPLAIEQTMMIDHSRSDDNHPYYRRAMAAQHPDAAFVFVSETGNPWTLKPGRYDVSVFFPPATGVDGRPDWLSLEATRHLFAVSGSDCLDRYPCLLEARYAAEGDDAVAADRVVLEASARSRLFLFPGSYRLSASDRKGNVIAARDIRVE